MRWCHPQHLFSTCAGHGRQEEELDASTLRDVLTQMHIISATVQVQAGCTGSRAKGRTAPIVHRGIAGGLLGGGEYDSEL